jgi:hypothetical protein
MLISSLILGALPLLALGQRTPTLGLSSGYLNLNIGSTAGVQLVKDSQVLASFKPSSAAAFDFAPFDKLSQRQYNGYVLIATWQCVTSLRNYEGTTILGT